MAPSGSLRSSTVLFGVVLLLLVFVDLTSQDQYRKLKERAANKVIDFDDISSTNHDRISAEETNSNWLSNTYHRVKRGLFDFFGKSDDDNTNDSDDLALTTTTSESTTTLGATKSRRGDSGSQEENDVGHNGRVSQEDVDDNGEIDREDEDDYDDLAKGEESAYVTGTKTGGGNSRILNSDDEDLAAENSGDIGGNSGSHPGGLPSSGKIVFFRISFTVEEPYHRAYDDRNSHEFKALSRNITQSIQNIYENLDGIQTATVIKIAKREGEAFQSQVTLDLGTKHFYDQNKIKMILLDHIRDYHTLGGFIQVNDDDFKFIAFGENEPPLPPDCPPHQLQCNNGECIDGSARCNGVIECDDGSDENGCGDFPLTTPSLQQQHTQTIPPTPSTSPITDYDQPTAPSTHTDQYPTIPHSTWSPPTTVDGADSSTGASSVSPLPVGRCRADDFVRCNNSQVIICEAQLCDGQDDCPGGGDEENCDADRNECAIGELSCDIYRCIPESQMCDGVKNCEDGTDEQDCPAKCRSDQFTCDDNSCIENYKRCDGQSDCPRAEDELYCPPAKEYRCSSDELSCGDGSCIRQSAKCDGKYDCPDNSDEKNCPCKPNQFACGNEFCISLEQRCDGIHNCQDKSDEIGCKNTSSCRSHEWRCLDGTCVDQLAVCNRAWDCSDGSDEAKCCKADEFRCSNHTCLLPTMRCDGVADCPFSEDEENCVICEEHQFRCQNGECIDERDRCNGRADCSDNSDEDNCSGIQISSTASPNNEWSSSPISTTVQQYAQSTPLVAIASSSTSPVSLNSPTKRPSSTNFTIHYFKPPLSSPVSNDSTVNVQIMHPISCDSNDSFRCNDDRCIKGSYRCDTVPDCKGGEDEENCMDGEDYEEGSYEDGDNDVDTKEDREKNVPQPQAHACAEDEFTCTAGGKCIPLNQQCDDYEDCEDGSDENECGPVEDGTCASDEFECGPGEECVPLERKCDGVPDCTNHRDEYDCAQVRPRCASSQFQCHSDGACIPLHGRCDGTVQCHDQSDERECGCNSQQFSCHSSPDCIPLSHRCDRHRDCPDGSDEESCPSTGDYYPPEQPHPTSRPPLPVTCPQGQQLCRSGGQCLPYAAWCDGRVDCNDLSDEENCPPQLSTTTTTTTTEDSRVPVYEPPVQLSCDWGYFRCENGPCIRQEFKCNGRVDCPHDDSDELDCDDQYNHVEQHYAGRDGLNLRTYPSSQEILESIYKPGREVVFQCRDEGPIRARVHWTRANGMPLPPGSRDTGGRLEMPNVQISDSGAYICAALGYPQTAPGSMVKVNLTVDPYIAPTSRPLTACGLYEATCSNGDCVPKQYVCDGKIDCNDGSDESRCSPHGCEPDEFRCRNKRCVVKTWQCDLQDDCGDGSDEEGCEARPHQPGESGCAVTQFSCRSGNMCIPKSFHCDKEIDCSDSSDEVGCSKPVISKPPSPMVQLDIGALFQVSCSAVGIPTPEVVWRLNWGHIPSKCSYVSTDGIGTLTCPDIQEEDQGAYSCEAVSNEGKTFAVPDTILVVNPQRTTCPRGSFNEDAVFPSDCLSCFCFGVTTDCASADLFTYQLQPPFDSHNFVAVHVDPITGIADIRDTSAHQLFRGSAPPRLIPLGRNSVQARYNPIGGPNDIVPYFALPENHLGNQLKSYGGYLKYGLKVESGGGRTIHAPDVIISGNGYTLIHNSPHPPAPSVNSTLSVRFFTGEWLYRTETAPERLATREELMMTLADVRQILVRLQYNEGVVDTTLSNVEMDSAGVTNTGLGQANFVEECRCPVGYSGLSCENCGSGFSRHRSGPWLGQCFKEVETCPPGTYGDPSRGISCQTCPCPLTHPSNQFGRTCSLDPDGDVTCDCPPGYVGRRCEKCDYGYTGNPLISGDYCKIGSICNANGSVSNDLDQHGRCHCKDYTDGPTCDQCKPNTFYLNRDNQFGCIACFCMGITQDCTSSNYYRNSISTGFTNSINDFKLIRLQEKQSPITADIRLDQQSREIVYSDFREPDTYYWSVPSRFLGDKVTSYGGNLRYTLRYVPIPGGQSSRNNAPDVELISENHINLLYFAREQNPAPDSTHSFIVPMLEQYWQRSDGQKADREHLLMALADLKAILIKASYTTNTREAALQSVSLDIADERNTGSYDRASAVEQCHCPAGYTGLSCEDCDAGYTRSASGIYLGLCQPCSCNGHSNDCDPETGTCYNCRSHTSGDSCDRCATGYIGDPAQREPCRPDDSSTGVYSNSTDGSSACDCEEAGSTQTGGCIAGQCLCKTNVEGYRCDRCRDGTFGLSSALPEGCQSCFCSGIVTECRSSDLYIQQIPSQIIDEYNHGFTLTDQYHRQPITSHFQLNVAMNEIGYVFRPSNTDRLFWSLPAMFTGNRIKSYGGNLEFTQRFTERPDAQYNIDQDVIISGNGITIFWTNANGQTEMKANIANRVSIPISTSAKWQRGSHHAGPRPASREDLMRVLANVDYILIRAKLSSDTASTFISDITLDTAVETFTGQDRAIGVEVCRCSEGYRGTSCEQCKPGYYRDINDVSRGPLGSCTQCPCSSNSQGCSLSPENEIVCICTPGWTGRLCESSPITPSSTPVARLAPTTTNQLTIAITPDIPPTPITSGTIVPFTCSYRNSRRLHFVVDINSVQLDPRQLRYSLEEWVWKGDKISWDIVICDPITVVQCHVFDEWNMRVGMVIMVVQMKSEGPAAAQPVYPGPIISDPNRPTQPTITITISSPPNLTIQSIGSTVRYTCSARSTNPNPVRLYWSRSSGELPARAIDDRRGLLVITDLRVSDSGTYVCHASDGVSVNIKEVNLIVGSNEEEPPKVTIQPSYVQVHVGQPIDLTCSAVGNPSPYLQWNRKDGQPMNERHTFHNGHFHISNALATDQGVYECTAQNGAGHDRLDATVYVLSRTEPVYPPLRPHEDNEPRIEPQYHSGRPGDIITFRCSASTEQATNAAQIVWQRADSDGGQLPYSSRDDGRGQLEFRETRIEDSGTYECRVIDRSGNVGIGRAVLNITEGEGTIPSVTISPSDRSNVVAQGDSITLHCHVSGLPTPTIKWSRLGTPLPTHITQTSTTLQLTNVQMTDRDVYICVATNAHGYNQASTIVEVEPREAPIVEMHPQTPQSIIEGGQTLLQCRLNAGIPNPAITWSRPGGRQMGPNVEEMQGGVLKITQITTADSGTYICTAENAAGRATATGNIIVQSPPTITVSPSGGIYHATEGREVRIECKAYGTPEPTVQWNRYEGRDRLSYPIRSMSRSTHMAVLQITSATASDSGIYVCLANNAAGAAEERIQLVLNGSYPQRGDITGNHTKSDEDATGGENALHPLQQPGWGHTKDTQYRPALINEKITAPVGTRAELRCSYSSDSGNQLIINWERLDRQPLKGNHIVRDGVLYIDDVQQSDAGVYRCYGINTRTNRVEIDINADLEVTSPPHISLRPPKQIVRPGDSATIECIVTGDQPISVTWQAVQRDMPRSVRVYNDALLQFHGIEVSDAGRYLCKARNSAGESDAVAEVIVQENAPPSQSVTHTITAHTHEYHLTSGQTARLQCSVDDPSVGVHWFRENSPRPYQLPRNSRVLGEGGEVLELIDVQEEDSGRYVCETSGEGGASDWIQVYVTNRRPIAHVIYPPNFPNPSNITTPPQVYITPSSGEPAHLGDNVDVQCRSSEPGVITTWSKLRRRDGGTILDSRLRGDDNVEIHGGQLRIRDVRSDNVGVWRCEARGSDGQVYSEDWTLDVVDSLEMETMPLDVKTVPKGSSIILQCSSNLEPPVVFHWTRQGAGEIQQQIDTHRNQLKLQDVSARDAGIYVCSASSNHRTINTPTVLVVTGILPYFSQAPISFISLPMIPDSYNHFTFEVSIKPQSPDGLVLYNGNNRNTEFISLVLIDGKPQFKINMGNGVTTLTHPEKLEIDKWHTIKVARNKKKITMYVDGRTPETVISPFRFSILKLNEPLYLAGHPALTTLTPVLDIAQGFVGCVSRLKVASNVEYDLIADAHSREGVTTCEECSGGRGPDGSQCENGGVCQEELSKEGFKCVCREGYGGRRCERRRGDGGEENVCTPDICGQDGRCIEATSSNPSIQCRCPLGRVGPHCQNLIKITDPAFSGEPGAYIAYPTPRAQRSLKITLTAKPASSTTTGLLVYCADSDEGQGEFVAISLRDGHVEFRFDVGNGLVTLRSPRPLTADTWHAISASKTYNNARLIVDGRDMISEKTTGNQRTLYLQTALYVGGVDHERVTLNEGVGLISDRDAFRGCIKNVTISGMNLDAINSITDSSNVQECSYLDELDDDLDEEDYGQNRRFNNYYPREYSKQKPVTHQTRETGCSSSPCRNDAQCYPLSPVEYRCNCINGYSGADCEIAPPLCQQLHPCQHSAPCTGNTTHYKCSCPLKYTGTNCEQSNDLRMDVHLDGDGWLEMPLMTDSYESSPRLSDETVFALEISTNATGGLLFWYGNKESDATRGDSWELEVPASGGRNGGDYVALQIIQGYLELSYDLGSGPAVILNDHVNVSDNNRHRVILKLQARNGSIDVDDHMEKGRSEGSSNRLNVNGNIYLGGVPDYNGMTHGRFHSGFNGCIHGFEINDSKSIEIGNKAINGSNVKPCSSYDGYSENDIDIDESYDDLVN